MVVTLLVLGKPVQVALCWSWQLAGFNLALSRLHLSGFNPVQVRTRMPGSCYRLTGLLAAPKFSPEPKS